MFQTAKRFFSAAVVMIVLVSGGFVIPAYGLNVGDPFPAFTMSNTLSSDECAYLHVSHGKNFSLEDIEHEIVIVEFLNVYCHTCRQQVEIFNELYDAIERDKNLSGRVCILGIAVGNTPEEIVDFKKDFGPLYPIVSDKEKRLFKTTGNTRGTPHTYILGKDGRYFVIDYHAGGVESHERYVGTITFALRGQIEGTEPGNKAVDFNFVAEGRQLAVSSFTGKKLLLYLPVDMKYPLEMDTRNVTQQLVVLRQLKENYKDLEIVVFPYQRLKIDEPEDFIIATDTGDATREPYITHGRPAVYYLNEYGRIVFKGDAITLYSAQALMEGQVYKPEPDMSESEIITMISEHIEKLGKKVLSTEKITLENRKTIYVTSLSPAREGVFLFSRLESNPSLCDICHDTHFLYILDQLGMIVDFIPVQLTKYGNVYWNSEDREKIKKNVAGKSIFQPFPFDPKVDAVTSATMTSSLIFESFNEAGSVWSDFKEHKFRSEYWKQVCFEKICIIKKKVDAMRQSRPDIVLGEQMIRKVQSSHPDLVCPLHGFYIVLDGNILCSIHGTHTGGCKNK